MQRVEKRNKRNFVPLFNRLEAFRGRFASGLFDKQSPAVFSQVCQASKQRFLRADFLVQ